MERLFDSSEKMVIAKKKAMEQLRSMSFEELLAMSEENEASPTVEFLSACNFEANVEPCFAHSQDEYSVAVPKFFLDKFIAATTTAFSISATCRPERAPEPFSPFSHYELAAA